MSLSNLLYQQTAQGCSEQTALERQDWPCMQLAHHELQTPISFLISCLWLPWLSHDRQVVCRKFDMRQWVLVTNSAPMTAWFYQDCYLRFCAEDYSLSDLTNVFSHLSNNCIARKSLHFESGHSLTHLPLSCTAYRSNRKHCRTDHTASGVLEYLCSGFRTQSAGC